MPNNNLVISAPRQGISQSPHTGFADVRNLDINSIPGIARLNKILVKKSGSEVTRPIYWKIRNPLVSTEFFAVGDTGIVLTSTDSGDTWAVLPGNGLTNAAGQGLAIWKDYLFVARTTSLDTFGPLSGQGITGITIASPGIVQHTAHGFSTQDGTTIIFSTSGALPTGLTAGTLYYVGTVHNVNEFSVSLTQAGADINTTGTQSGTHKYKFWRSSLGDSLTFKTIDSDVLWHPMWVSKNDNKLYGGAGRFVFSLDEVSGQTFTPITAGTFTWTQQALDLPSPYRIKCIRELGNFLMLGTWQGTAVTDFPIADIFPWDRSSASFGQPISLNDFGIHAMENTGNSLVVLAGVKGSIYRCDGGSIYLIGQLPIELSVTKFINWFPGSICNFKNKIFIGSGGNSALAGQGIYSLQQTGQGNILNLEHLNSNLTDGSVSQVAIHSLLPVSNDVLLASWTNGSAWGIDKTDSTSYLYTTDYSGYFESPLYVVGSLKNPRIFTELEFQFAKKLATGEGIRVKYRVNLTDSFTTLDTYTFTTLGAVISHYAIANIPACEMLQIRVELLGTATTTPQFRSLTLL